MSLTKEYADKIVEVIKSNMCRKAKFSAIRSIRHDYMMERCRINWDFVSDTTAQERKDADNKDLLECCRSTKTYDEFLGNQGWYRQRVENRLIEAEKELMNTHSERPPVTKKMWEALY